MVGIMMTNKKVVLITGGMGGIGTALSEAFANDYQVIASYYKQGAHEEAKAWQLAMHARGFPVEIIYADITRYEDCETMVSLLMERFGRIDVLINNAGITDDVSLKKMTRLQWDNVIDANLSAVFNVTRCVLPHMIDALSGRIISISSINGRKGQLGQCNYAASKAGLIGFSKSLALEVANKGITVNVIAPGYIETPMLTSLKPDVLESIIAAIPMKRLGKSEEVANLTLTNVPAPRF